MKKLFLCIFVGAALPVAAQNSLAVNWKTYDDSTIGFSIQYPATWEASNTDKNAALFLFSPQAENDRFRENLNLQAGKGGGKLDEYVKSSVTDLKNNIKNFKIISQRKLMYHKNTAVELIFTGNLDNINYPLHWKQLYIIIAKGSYVLTYTSESGKPDIYAATADRIFKSFLLF